MSTLHHALAIGHRLARRDSLTIPEPEDVARDPARMARFLAAFEALERDPGPAPEPDARLYESRCYAGVSVGPSYLWGAAGWVGEQPKEKP